YGYFGICPAVLRLPFVALGIGFGKLSRALMTVYFMGALLASYLILMQLRAAGRDALPRAPARPVQRRCTRRVDSESKPPSSTATLLLIVNVGAGSTLLFLASRAYVYHEAILAGAAFALGSAYFTLRYLSRPCFRSAAGALALGVCAAHCRPTSGLFALSFLAACALITMLCSRQSLKRAAIPNLTVALLSVIGFLSFNGISYLKFHTFDGMPLRYNIQFLENPGRLSHINGEELHVGNIRLNADAYFGSFTGEFMRQFPYIRNQGVVTYKYAGTVYDLSEPILAIPYCMPGLAVLSLMGMALGAFAGQYFRRVLIALAVAFVPMALVLFMAVVSSQRYTGDFVPALVIAAGIGLAVSDIRTWRAWLQMSTIPFAIASVFVTFALALHYQGEEVWGVPDSAKSHYRHIKHWFDKRFNGSSS
ncbi:MAG TPA: hypothetical protein VK673_01355, partial [Chthoniobacterales bacterium]|nr:hypothetical protein [Chthoniobacterales bacterium]